MSDIATGVVSRLAGAGITAYPEYVREADNVYPLAVYQIKINPVSTFDGSQGIRYAILTVAALDKTYGGASTLAALIEATLEGLGATWGGIHVQGSFLQDDGVTDDVVTEPTTEQILAFVKTLTFDVAVTY